MPEQHWDIEPEIGEQLFGGARHGTGLLGALRAAGLSIGPREQVAVAALLMQLTTDIPPGAQPRPLWLGALGPQLAPLLARSREERRTFFQVFEALKPGWSDGLQGDVTAAQVEVAAPAPRVSAPPSRKNPLRIVGLVAAAVLLIAAPVAYFATRSAPPAVELAPETPPPSVAELTPTAPEQAAPETQDLVGLRRIQEAAAPYFGAPTLTELADELSRTSEIGWSAAAYAQRLHELTGLPRHEPLRVVVTAREPQVGSAQLIALAAAVDAIERPGREAATTALAAAANTVLLDANAVTLADGALVARDLVINPDLSKAEALAEIRARLNEATPEPVPPGAGWSQDLPDAAIERALAITTDPNLRRVWPDAPWLEAAKTNPPTAPWWALILAGLIPLALGIAWLANAILFKRAFLRQRRPAFPPTHMDLLAEAKARAKASIEVLHLAAQRLARRTSKETDRLDIERTVRATIRDGGLMVKPVFARTRAAPDYLALIEKRTEGDHDFERMRDMVVRLRESELVPVEVFSYQRDPSILIPENGGRPLSLDALAAKHPDHRLIILGSGEGFLDRKGRPIPSAEKLTRWDRRALLSPLPIAEWAREEFELARELDMAIGRATPEGFLALADMLGLDGQETGERVRTGGDGLARPLPEVFRFRAEDFFYETPPGDVTIAQTVQDLRNYLDPAGFDWLCALAVYPAIQWDLTVFLGVELADPRNGAPLYTEERIAAIALLPWFREGRMPNWLRRALIAEMPKAFEVEVRSAVNRVLQEAQARADEAENERIRFRIALEAQKEPLAPDELLDDEVLLDFLSRGALEDFRPDRAPSEPDKRARRFGLLHGVIAGVAIAYTAAAIAIAPKPWDGPLITGAWLPLILLALGGLLGIAAGFPRSAYAIGQARLEEAGPYGLVFAGVVGAGWALTLAAPLAAPPTWGLLLALTTALLVWPARAMAHRLGGYPPEPKRPWLRALGVGAATLLTLIAAAGAVQVFGTVGRSVAIGMGLALFAVGITAARFAPQRLAPPKEKKPLSAPANLWLGGARTAAVLAGALPALALAAWLGAAQLRVPPVLDADQRAEQILAASAEGRYFATGGADGAVRVYDASAPRTPLVTFAADGGGVCPPGAPGACDPPRFPAESREGPVISLAVQDVADGRVLVAAATLTGTVRLFDGRGGSLIQDTGLRSAGLRPLIALDADGRWAVARQDDAGSSVLTTSAGVTGINLGGPIVALAAAENARGRWLLALADGRLGLAQPEANLISFASQSLFNGEWRRPDIPDSLLSVQFNGAEVVIREANFESRNLVTSITEGQLELHNDESMRLSGDDRLIYTDAQSVTTQLFRRSGPGEARLPGRARALTVTGATVRAIGDDGSIMEADLTPASLTNARLLPADPRLALGPAVGWRFPRPLGPGIDIAACSALAQQIQAGLTGRALQSGAGPRAQQARLQAQFTETCPGLSVDALAMGPQTVVDADPPQCAPFAQEWQGMLRLQPPWADSEVGNPPSLPPSIRDSGSLLLPGTTRAQWLEGANEVRLARQRPSNAATETFNRIKWSIPSACIRLRSEVVLLEELVELELRGLRAAETVATRGQIASLQGDYSVAAEHYARAAETVPQTEWQARWRYRERQAYALYEHGRRLNDSAPLLEAARLYREVVLPLSPRADSPSDWARTQNNLGLVLQELGKRGDDQALQEAIAAFSAALSVFTRAAAPADWATTQNNLGNALRVLGERGDNAALARAVVAYQAALEVQTRDRDPAAWATTQVGLGNALTALGERGDNAALARAVVAYQAALEVQTRDRDPAAWATTQLSLAVAFRAGGRLADARAAAQLALEHYESVGVRTGADRARALLAQLPPDSR